MSAYVSAFELFSIGVGPSSSHTVGPMRAARDFAARVREAGVLARAARVTCTLFGSLGATGLGHGTPDAVVAGLQGLVPETVDPDAVRHAWTDWPDGAPLTLDGTQPVPFAKADVTFAARTRLPAHPNAMTLTVYDADAATLAEETYYSIGGGFIRREGEPTAVSRHPYPLGYDTAAELLDLCDEHSLTIAEVARRNEESLRGEAEVAEGLDAIWDAMAACVDAGLDADGILPGVLKVKRRAHAIRTQLEQTEADRGRELPEEWLGAFALAVNEENASGGRVVTAPTNGAAGIVPAVAMYWWRFLADAGLGAGNAVTPHGELVGSALLGFGAQGADAAGQVDAAARADAAAAVAAPTPDATDDGDAVAEANRRRGIRRYLLTATALGSLFKANASISGAEGGCQAEVGSACAMAAGGLTAVMGGTNRQIENAAEIAMEHHLGLTCDPVAGLVQIPCIERNAIAASTAVTAARLALRGDGSHYVPLDTVVETMRQTGIDMSTKYKETSEGGLAVNVIEC
ncbi:L-serine ammonia-lyase, iron-sulfur-dependent, subunit alpha [Microbacterium sp.]|uniref:L-serine ammonia-lyase, iron-sulfur-dependent, subunit alpha n=1 Tax=Microbacterium sp. TaxID=51671 RepID=UPI003A92305F